MKTKWMLSAALALTLSLTFAPVSVANAADVESGNQDIRAAVTAKWDRSAGALTDEQKAKIAAMIESGELPGFRGGKHGYAVELTDEQRAELAEKRAAMIESGEFPGFLGGKHGDAAELTDEQRAELAEKRAAMIESGEYPDFQGWRGKAAELTDEQKAEIAAKRATAGERGEFDGVRGDRSSTHPWGEMA